MDKKIYVAIEDWENYNSIIVEIADTIQEFSTKDFVTATLLQELARLVEERFVIWQRIQGFGFTDILQARAALWSENQRLEQTADNSLVLKERM